MNQGQKIDDIYETLIKKITGLTPILGSDDQKYIKNEDIEKLYNISINIDELETEDYLITNKNHVLITFESMIRLAFTHETPETRHFTEHFAKILFTI